MQYGGAQIVMSDSFDGFTCNQVECIRTLPGLKDPSPSELSRLTFGCTCEQSLNGFLSSRTAFALTCQGEVNHDMLADT